MHGWRRRNDEEDMTTDKEHLSSLFQCLKVLATAQPTPSKTVVQLELSIQLPLLTTVTKIIITIVYSLKNNSATKVNEK
jgi:hypothetical protein